MRDGDGAEAAGVGAYLELAPRLLAFLTWREERRVARSALAQLGDHLAVDVAQLEPEHVPGAGLLLGDVGDEALGLEDAGDLPLRP